MLKGGPCIIKAGFENKKKQVMTCQWEDFHRLTKEVIHKKSGH